MTPERDNPGRLLVRHFVRRLLDNDLLSWHVDRRESMATTCAALASLGVFATFFLSFPYLTAFIQLPGPTTLSALSDRFLFIVSSMVFAGMAALTVWEALALEPRDVAILGPLPIGARTITRAKLGAVLLLGTVVVGVLNLVPSVLYPVFLTVNLRSTTGSGLLLLIGGHASTTVAAGLYAFFAVLAIRGVLRMALGERGFASVASLVQSSFVAACVTALLLAPTVTSATVQEWIAGRNAPRWPMTQALWFLGMNESLVGHVVSDAPIVTPGHVEVRRSSLADNAKSLLTYRALRGGFVRLARTVVLVPPLVVIVAIATFLWNNRRYPDRAISSQTTSRLRAAVTNLAERLTRRNREAQAGFFFTLETLARSEPHRLIVAVSAAATIALAFVVLVSGSIASRFALQILVLMPLLAGFRYAVLVPAELASNWTFQMAWLGDERGYVTGVKRAGAVALIAVPLLLLLPVHIALFGFTIAVVHSLCGFLFAMAALDVLFLTYRRLPFACSYLPIENLRIIWPVSIVLSVLVALGVADVERFALQTPLWTIGFLASLTAIVAVVARLDRVWRQQPIPVDFLEKPAPPTQRLGLFERIVTND